MSVHVITKFTGIRERLGAYRADVGFLVVFQVTIQQSNTDETFATMRARIRCGYTSISIVTNLNVIVQIKQSA